MEIVAYVALGIFVACWLIVGTLLVIEHHKEIKRCQLHLSAHHGGQINCGECYRCYGVMREGQG